MNDQRDDAPWAADPPNAGADPERLAALLDGRVDGAERDALLARLADHDDDLALFAEAAAIQRALEEEDAATRMTDAPVPPMVAAVDDGPGRPADHDNDLARFAGAAAARHARENASAGIGHDADTHAAPAVADADEPMHDPDVIPIRRRRPQRVDRRLVQLAAVLAGVTLLPLAWVAGRPGAVSSPSQAVAMLDERDAELLADWTHPWVRRGGGSASAEERSTAARVGALAVDLELAIRAGDVEQRQQRVGQIQGQLESTSALAGDGFDALAESTSTDREQLLADLESAMEAATGFLDEDFVALGAWAEAARFAAEGQNAEFFRGTRTARTLAKAETLLGDNEQARAALAQIATARAADPPNWAVLRKAADELLRVIT